MGRARYRGRKKKGSGVGCSPSIIRGKNSFFHPHLLLVEKTMSSSRPVSSSQDTNLPVNPSLGSSSPSSSSSSSSSTTHENAPSTGSESTSPLSTSSGSTTPSSSNSKSSGSKTPSSSSSSSSSDAPGVVTDPSSGTSMDTTAGSNTKSQAGTGSSQSSAGDTSGNTPVGAASSSSSSLTFQTSTSTSASSTSTSHAPTTTSSSSIATTTSISTSSSSQPTALPTSSSTHSLSVFTSTSTGGGVIYVTNTAAPVPTALPTSSGNPNTPTGDGEINIGAIIGGIAGGLVGIICEYIEEKGRRLVYVLKEEDVFELESAVISWLILIPIRKRAALKKEVDWMAFGSENDHSNHENGADSIFRTARAGVGETEVKVIDSPEMYQMSDIGSHQIGDSMYSHLDPQAEVPAGPPSWGGAAGIGATGYSKAAGDVVGNHYDANYATHYHQALSMQQQQQLRGNNRSYTEHGSPEMGAQQYSGRHHHQQQQQEQQQPWPTTTTTSSSHGHHVGTPSLHSHHSPNTYLPAPPLPRTGNPLQHNLSTHNQRSYSTGASTAVESNYGYSSQQYGGGGGGGPVPPVPSLSPPPPFSSTNHQELSTKMDHSDDCALAYAQDSTRDSPSPDKGAMHGLHLANP